jgi:hypothetical protein
LAASEPVVIDVKPEPIPLTTTYIGYDDVTFSVVAESSPSSTPVMLTPPVAQMMKADSDNAQAVSAVPEPAMPALLAIGLVGLLARRRGRLA